MKPAPLSLLVALALIASAAPTAWADALLIERARAANAQPNLPTRGQTSAQVEQKFGAPQEKLEPRGGQKSQWPVINRWVYPEYTVYFERQRVINVVLNTRAASSVGGTGTGSTTQGEWWDEPPTANTDDPENFIPGADGDAWEQEPDYAEDDNWPLPTE